MASPKFENISIRIYSPSKRNSSQTDPDRNGNKPLKYLNSQTFNSEIKKKIKEKSVVEDSFR